MNHYNDPKAPFNHRAWLGQAVRARRKEKQALARFLRPGRKLYRLTKRTMECVRLRFKSYRFDVMDPRD